jgi:SNF2 family DNA or RNA helicase
MAHLVVARFRRMDITALPYTGNESQQERDHAEQSFQSGDTQVISGTIAAGGEGIQLFRGSTVVFLDRMWNPTKNLQAEDRLHRIGQVNPVQVIDIRATNTVDLGRKQRIANKWAALRIILGDTIKEEEYLNV